MAKHPSEKLALLPETAASFMRLILTTIILTMLAKPVWAHKFDIDNILKLFPICETQSSLGQACKYRFNNSKPANFLEDCCEGNEKISYEGNTVKILTSGDWLYWFKVTPINDDAAQITFGDRAMNGGSYFVVTEYLARLNDGELLLEEQSSNHY